MRVKNKAIFLDRDGVINKEINYLHKIQEFEFTDNCIDALKTLQSHGYLLFIIQVVPPTSFQQSLGWNPLTY